MILVKKLKFFHILCLSKIDRENVFADVLDKKEAFKDYKNNCCTKNVKLEFFQKGLVHRFGQKFELLLTFQVMENKLRKSIWLSLEK